VNSIFTYGAAWPSDYPANPIYSDSSANNAQQMAAFSSRGPTDDNRIKPDVVAPGTWILSAYSDLYQQGYDGSTNPRTTRINTTVGVSHTINTTSTWAAPPCPTR
jgi:hypothetical protein